MTINNLATRIIIFATAGISLTAFAVVNNPGKAALKITDSLITIPMGGNAWRLDKDTTGGAITNKGIVNWSNSRAKFNTYVRTTGKGRMKVWLSLKGDGGATHISVSALNITKNIVVKDNTLKDYYAGEWTVRDTGYMAFRVAGISKTGKTYADVSSIKLSGPAVESKTAYVKNNEGNYFYWGRRGPSVHLGYVMPDNVNAEWFYNEVTVPVRNDVLGSYFMADGFAEGYFGMQVNSPTERHILFSVWSPFVTDNPKDIPDSKKIVMLKKGDNVHTGEFGSEGSGGQSYMNYNWKAGNTYKFLLHAKPDGNNHTIYTTWFFAPELNKWHLIASFSRPETNTYLKHLHSFLENFDPEQGTITRRVLFTNQWVADGSGKWIRMNKARFTIDNTGIKGYRMDYAGGTDGNAFYLKNCGFFNSYTTRNTVFERPATGKMPDVELDKLP